MRNLTLSYKELNFRKFIFPELKTTITQPKMSILHFVFFCKDPNFDTPNRFCNHNCVVNEVTGVIFYVCMPLIYSMDLVMIFLF